MAELEDLQARVAALEALVTELAERVTDAHTLAAHADRDVAEFRGELRVQTRLIGLTREDMGSLRSEVARGFERLGRVETGQQMVIDMLQRLIDRDAG